jgi:hypothetical protein
MRRVFLLIAAMALGAPAAAQQPVATTRAADEATVAGVQVSLDRIRDGLRHAESQRILRNLTLTPNFRLSIEEQDRIDRLMSKIEVPKAAPVPGGGWYGYEQQRQLFNPTNRPLQQPYAAFSGGQLVTVALENLLGRYGGKKLVDAVQNNERTRAESAARQEVERSIAAYCDARSDRDFIQLCTSRER